MKYKKERENKFMNFSDFKQLMRISGVQKPFTDEIFTHKLNMIVAKVF